jgi:hypothetical protein
VYARLCSLHKNRQYNNKNKLLLFDIATKLICKRLLFTGNHVIIRMYNYCCDRYYHHQDNNVQLARIYCYDSIMWCDLVDTNAGWSSATAR